MAKDEEFICYYVLLGLINKVPFHILVIVYKYGDLLYYGGEEVYI